MQPQTRTKKRKYWLWLLLSLSVPFGLGGILYVNFASERPSSFQILLTSCQGRPIVGAKIEVYNKSNSQTQTFQTNSQGRAFLPLDRIYSYRLRCQAQGFRELSLNLTPEQIEDSRLHIRLMEKHASPASLKNSEASYRIEGKILPALPGAEVMALELGAERRYSVSVGEGGEFEFPALPAGLYHLYGKRGKRQTPIYTCFLSRQDLSNIQLEFPPVGDLEIETELPNLQEIWLFSLAFKQVIVRGIPSSALRRGRFRLPSLPLGPALVWAISQKGQCLARAKVLVQPTTRLELSESVSKLYRLSGRVEKIPGGGKSQLRLYHLPLYPMEKKRLLLLERPLRKNRFQVQVPRGFYVLELLHSSGKILLQREVEMLEDQDLILRPQLFPLRIETSKKTKIIWQSHLPLSSYRMLELTKDQTLFLASSRYTFWILTPESGFRKEIRLTRPQTLRLR
ncbi:MAG: carboxypeptidase regulatory-like domain-containing protein [Planctomycetota bacterium]|nr:MAG: carboxypeptidase regulatory-like domain-containing protein [Planctomycetota bacterium]